jgi:ribosomal protein S18 acetylase RimI-like enzyme
MNSSRLTDKDAIRAFLNRDRALTAYALGDLDDAFWPESEYYGAQQGDELVALVLVYRGLDPAVMTGYGDAQGMQAIVAAADLPGEIYYLWPPDLEPILAARYTLPHQKREWRMVLDAAQFDPPALDGVVRIQPEQADDLAALYRHAAEPGEEVVAFSPWQIAHGVFYGVWQAGELVAAAGTHVWSRAEGVAAIGNVFTHPAHRGQGFGTRCTAAVVRDALAAGIDPVVLNVRHGNAPAIHIYEKLGFRRYCTFLEGPGLAR